MSNYLARYLSNIFYHGMEMFGKYYSTYRGYVVDNQDSEGLGRLSVIVPQVTGKAAHIKLAYPKGNFSGKDYGIQMLPRKGDLVWVEFEFGNTANPIWSHAYYSKNQKPTEFSSANIYGFKSPGKQLILINDDEGKIYLRGSDEGELGENEGLVKVIELTDKLNDIIDKLNDVITKYNTHTHSVSGASTLVPTGTPATSLGSVNKDDIQNNTILH